MKKMKLRVTMEKDEKGIYTIECLSLPGCISQGETKEEALKNIKDAAKGYLKSLKKHNEKIPSNIEEGVVELYV